MTRPRLLDLFCKAGGAAVGYHRAGFDVVGVDIEPQPRYPYEFMQRDAMLVLKALVLTGAPNYDAIHASPPCQDHTTLAVMRKPHGTGWLLDATRQLLDKTGLPWVIENVPGAPMRADYRLCGCMFGLPGLRRDRWFETSWHGFDLKPPHYHTGRAVTVVGHPGGRSNRDGYSAGSSQERITAMGIDWMTQAELSQAIPPAYTEYIGRALLDHLAEQAAS